MQIGVSSYSFNNAVKNASMDFLDIPFKAKEIGFDVVEFSKFLLPEGETPLSYAPKVREACDKAGIKIANYTIGADFLTGSNGDWEKEATRLKDELKVAQILGAPGMRHDTTSGFGDDVKRARSFDDALPTLIKGCRTVTEYAASLGIKTMIENHGFFAQDSARVEKIVSGVNHPNFGVLVDVGNFLCADEDPGKAVGLLMPYAFHVHAKDFHIKSGMMPDPGKGWIFTRGGNYIRGSIIGHGDVPIMQCLKIMKKVGYNGVLSIEFEGLEEPVKAISLGFKNLTKYVSEIFG